MGAGGFLGKNVAMALLAGTFGLTFLAFFVPSLKKVIANSSATRKVRKASSMPDIPADLANREYADVYQPPKASNLNDAATDGTEDSVPEAATEANGQTQPVGGAASGVADPVGTQGGEENPTEDKAGEPEKAAAPKSPL